MREKPFPLNFLPTLSYMRYALEALYTMEVANFYSVVGLQGLDLETIVRDNYGYDLWGTSMNCSFLYLIGFLLRVAAGVAMYASDSKKKV
jgi:hypothetical protein